eukprot:Gb_12028 [translate_table: standard]
MKTQINFIRDMDRKSQGKGAISLSLDRLSPLVGQGVHIIRQGKGVTSSPLISARPCLVRERHCALGQGSDFPVPYSPFALGISGPFIGSLVTSWINIFEIVTISRESTTIYMPKECMVES